MLCITIHGEMHMPLYEYHCKNCGENTEMLQKHSDEPEKICPHCHQESLEKQISSTNFQLKGGGWYVTDFKDKKETKSSSTEIKSDKKEVATPAETKKRKSRN
jgi:putative FmdB family regulatory protein